MRRTLIKVMVFVAAFGLGMSVVALWRATVSHFTASPLAVTHTIGGTGSPSVLSRIDPCSNGWLKEATLVLVIPSDSEIYLGKEKIELADVTNKANKFLGNRHCACRLAYVKAAEFVRFGKVQAVIQGLREACINKIGLVPDKRSNTNKAG